MLLHGPPGVGKTLTVESAAEVIKAPLYVMTPGDLGTNGERAERMLKDIFRMSPRWGAVLLLDEADAYLEARTSSDLGRNELVSILLRMFGYYEVSVANRSDGRTKLTDICMVYSFFLTTNRVDNIDPAFESLIHVSLQYPDLDVLSRRHVWSTFLNRVENREAFSNEALEKLSQERLNGRQIKNVVKIAQALATEQGTELDFLHVDMVLRLKAANPNTRFEWTVAMKDLDCAVENPSTAVYTTLANHPDKGNQSNDVGSSLRIRFERTQSMDDINRAVQAASMAKDATPQDHPDRADLLHNLGIWLGRRFERTSSMNDLNRAGFAEMKNLSPELKNLLEMRLKETTHLTYLWVYLVFDYLEGKMFQKTPNGTKAPIATLPKSIYEAYEQILNKTKDDERAIVWKSLSIILAARRPLTISEMNIALNIDDKILHIQDLDLEDNEDFKSRPRTWCELFVSVYYSKIYFLHQTAREFLIANLVLPVQVLPGLQWRHSITTQSAHTILAEAMDSNGGTPLSYAARNGHEAVVKLLLENDAGVEARMSEHGQTPLLFAAANGWEAVVKLLLENGADIEVKESEGGLTPLLLAAADGHGAVVKLLLENDADIEAKD